MNKHLSEEFESNNETILAQKKENYIKKRLSPESPPSKKDSSSVILQETKNNSLALEHRINKQDAKQTTFEEQINKNRDMINENAIQLAASQEAINKNGDMINKNAIAVLQEEINKLRIETQERITNLLLFRTAHPSRF